MHLDNGMVADMQCSLVNGLNDFKNVMIIKTTMRFLQKSYWSNINFLVAYKQHKNTKFQLLLSYFFTHMTLYDHMTPSRYKIWTESI